MDTVRPGKHMLKTQTNILCRGCPRQSRYIPQRSLLSRTFAKVFVSPRQTGKNQGTNRGMAPDTLFFPARGTFPVHALTLLSLNLIIIIKIFLDKRKIRAHNNAVIRMDDSL
jgi:hypothetical protein